MTTIPNELKINIKTSIPGKQLFRLEPSMIIKNENSKDDTIQFNPLIKLKQQIVNKVPEYLRKKQFVDKGLFESLINLTNATPAKSLFDAKKNGYIDNNIGITLNTLIPPETIITIGGRQYVIVDLQWTPGSWKVDTKKKPPQYDSNKIADPFFFNAVITDELIKGESQLTQLQKTDVYGPNYTGPKDIPVSLTSVIGQGLPGIIGGPPPPPPPPPGGPDATSNALVPAPLNAADIAAAVAAAVAALPQKSQPTAKEIADAIVASFRTLAENAFRYSYGSGFTPRVFIQEVADAVHAALPPPPVYPAIAPPPTAAEIANALIAGLAVLPSGHPALPSPPVYPALPPSSPAYPALPPPAKRKGIKQKLVNGIKQNLNYYLPHGVSGGTPINIGKGIVSSILPGFQPKTPSTSPFSSSSSDSDSDSDSDVSSVTPLPPNKPSRPAAPIPTMEQINTDILLGQTASQDSSQIANNLMRKNVKADIINVFFTVKNLPIPSNIRDANAIKNANNINTFIQQNMNTKSQRDIISDILASGYNPDIVEAVFAARTDVIGAIQPKSPQRQPNRPFTPQKEPAFTNEISRNNTNLVRSAFKNESTLNVRGVTDSLRHKPTKFYNLLNFMYSQCEPENRTVLRSVLRNTTSVGINPDKDAITLSKGGYDESVNNLNVIKNRGGGDCLFIAAAQAINYHNFHSQQNRIIYKQLGIGNNEFTNENIRGLVADFFQSWSQLDGRLQIAAATTVPDLNTDFQEKINQQREAIRLQRQGGNNSVTEITPEVYRQILDDTYRTNPNFLAYSNYIFNPNLQVPEPSSPEYLTPFRLVTKGPELNEYISSQYYWAGGEAIIAISNVLKIQIIPIGIVVNNEGTDKSNPNYKILSIQSAHTNFDSGDDGWNKYLFLYYNASNIQQSHFELITFLNSNSGETTTIFDRSQSAHLPPLYILFTIFGLFYTSLSTANRRNFLYRRDLMETMNRAIGKLKTVGPDQYALFYSAFKNLFPNSQIEPPNSSSSGGSNVNNVNVQLGGYPPYGTPQYGTPQYGRPQYISNFVKTPQYVENSQLSYYITIELQLHPGTSISPEARKGLKCNHKWNAIKQSYSQFVGKQYNIKPDYSLIAQAPSPKPNTNPNPNPNFTRKYGGKTQKTRKTRTRQTTTSKTRTKTRKTRTRQTTRKTPKTRTITRKQ